MRPRKCVVISRGAAEARALLSFVRDQVCTRRRGVAVTPSDKANRQFWAARRANAPKAPLKLSVGDFVAEANRQLGADKSYVPGTRFVVVEPPEGGAPIPTWEGPEAMRPVIQRIVQKLVTRYELPVPFRIDRVA